MKRESVQEVMLRVYASEQRKHWRATDRERRKRDRFRYCAVCETRYPMADLCNDCTLALRAGRKEYEQLVKARERNAA